MAGKKGFGSQILYSTDGVNYTNWANVTKIKPFAAKADMVDVSAMDSPSLYKEKLSTLLDAGAASFDLNYDDKNAGHRWALANLGVANFFKIIGPGASPGQLLFQGFVKQLDPDYPHDKQLTASVIIEITSSITVV